jgi:hypothetical protein
MLLKKGAQIELRLRGEVAADQKTENSMIVVKCPLKQPSTGKVYWTFAIPEDVLPVVEIVKVVKA